MSKLDSVLSIVSTTVRAFSNVSENSHYAQNNGYVQNNGYNPYQMPVDSYGGTTNSAESFDDFNQMNNLRRYAATQQSQQQLSEVMDFESMRTRSALTGESMQDLLIERDMQMEAARLGLSFEELQAQRIAQAGGALSGDEETVPVQSTGDKNGNVNATQNNSAKTDSSDKTKSTSKTNATSDVKSGDESNVVPYTVMKGDNLTKILNSQGFDAAAIKKHGLIDRVVKANNLRNPNLIREGATLKLPILDLPNPLAVKVTADQEQPIQTETPVLSTTITPKPVIEENPRLRILQ